MLSFFTLKDDRKYVPFKLLTAQTGGTRKEKTGYSCFLFITLFGFSDKKSLTLQSDCWFITAFSRPIIKRESRVNRELFPQL